MNKKIVGSLFICTLIFLVSSTPIDSAKDGKDGGGVRYTESPMTTGPIIGTRSESESKQMGGSGEAAPIASDGTHTVSTPSQSPLAPGNDSTSTAATFSTPNTTTTTTTTKTTPTTTATKTTSPMTTTTEAVPTTTPTTTAIPNTTTVSPDTTTTKVPTTTVPSGTTTAAAATTTTSATPSKDRRFDGPSFIGGIVLSLGILAIGFVAFKFYKARTERNYHTL